MRAVLGYSVIVIARAASVAVVAFLGVLVGVPASAAGQAVGQTPPPRSAGTLTLSAKPIYVSAGGRVMLSATLRGRSDGNGFASVYLERRDYPFTRGWRRVTTQETDNDGTVVFSQRLQFWARFRATLSRGTPESASIDVYAVPQNKLLFDYSDATTRVIMRFRTPKTYTASGGDATPVRASRALIFFYAQTPKGSTRLRRLGRARLRANGGGTRRNWDAAISIPSRRLYKNERFYSCWNGTPIVGTMRPTPRTSCGAASLPLAGAAGPEHDSPDLGGDTVQLRSKGLPRSAGPRRRATYARP